MVCDCPGCSRFEPGLAQDCGQGGATAVTREDTLEGVSTR